MAVEWRVEITHDGIWPTKWHWRVVANDRSTFRFDSRSGDTFTKDRARRRALAAKRSMEEDDVRVVYPV